MFTATIKWTLFDASFNYNLERSLIDKIHNWVYKITNYISFVPTLSFKF